MSRVPFGSTASSFMFTAAIQPHLRAQVHPEKRAIAQLLLNSFYMEHLLFEANDFEELATLYKCTREPMDDARMLLRKWSSSCKQLERTFDFTNDLTL